MGDLIRRKDAVSRISDLLLIELQGKRLPTWNEVYNAINDIPFAEPERKWIPVTEALPEEETNVLVTVHYDGDKYYRYKPNDYVTTAEYICDRWCFADEEFIMQLHKHHVIAWAPLPEPYRGE